jgi:hypothetical protein
MTARVTPPICSHCGQLMQFVAANVNFQTPGAWDESWRCPDGAWSLRRTIPAPPRYGLAVPHPAPRASPRRARPKPRR